MIQTTQHCYNCDTHFSKPYSENAHKIVCPNCHAWIAKCKELNDLAALYGEDYYSGDEYLNYNLGKRVHAINFKRKLKILSKYFKDKNVRILEIGSATGEFLKVARDEGYNNIIGIEVSDFSRKQALSEGFTVLSPFDSQLTEKINSFSPNVILMWDVWEHLEEPTNILNQYLSSVSSGTIFSLTTVDAGSKNAISRQEKWRQFHPPTHLNYPTKKSFEIYLSRLNFRIKDHFYFGYYRPLAEYLAAVIGKNNYIKNSKLLFSLPIYLNLYDTQMFIAIKD